MSKMTRKVFLRSIFGATAASSLTACRPASPAGTTQQAATTGAAAAGAASAKAPSRSEKLIQRVFADTTSTYVVGAVFVGDRLGLFKAMAGAGALTGQQLSTRTKLDERYVSEWLRAMATSGYVDYHPEQRTFELPAEHVPVLVDENSPAFSMGLLEGAVPDVQMIPSVIEGFRSGKGIPYDRYPVETFESIERGTRPDYLHLLAQAWIPAVPGLGDRLAGGGTAADLGCGGGLASICLAKAFPKVRTVGFDPYAPSVARATRNAKDAGVSDRATFATFDGVHVPGGPYDLITINYALHHAGKPVDLMKSARAALAPGGVFLVVEYRKSERLEEDIDNDRRVLYGTGLLECLPTALAEGGPGYGTGILEPVMRKLSSQAGFKECSRILQEDPIRSLFVLRG